MRPYFYFALILILGIYFSLTYYIGIRLLRILMHWFPGINVKLYGLALIIIASLYIISRTLKDHLPLKIAKIVTTVGAYWLAAMFYFIIIFIAIDLFILILKVLGIVDASIVRTYTYLHITGIISIGLLSVLLVYGSIVARNPKIVDYDISLPRGEGNLEELTAVMISDVHLGKIIDNRELSKLVNMVYDIHPDIIFFAGDIIDEDIRPFTKEKMYETFGRLDPKYGMYACLGNHEYIGGHVEEITEYLEKSGIHVLIDEYILVEESIYIAGRNDPTGARIHKSPRKNLDEWIGDLDKDLPVILLDHQPKDLEEAAENGVDLMLSGHTHLGQFFPNMYITSIMYENDYGYSQKEQMDLIVSSGYGTWGPPIRIGTRGEIVKINIKFKEKE